MATTNAITATAPVAAATTHLIFNLSDLAIVIATLLGPILAIQAQSWIERRRAVRERRLTIFRTLMATRATRLSPVHVEALNAIPVEFYGPNKPKLKAITDDWRTYFDLLSDKTLNSEVGLVKRLDAFIDMLHKIAILLDYGFNRSEIMAVYHPEGHATIESEQDTIRKGFAKIFSGEAALPMAVKEFPSDPEFGDSQTKLNRLATEWLEGGRTVKVEAAGTTRVE